MRAGTALKIPNLIGDPPARRGGSRSLTVPGIRVPAAQPGSSMRERLPGAAKRLRVEVQLRARARVLAGLRSGRFEGPAIEKPPALPEDAYSRY